MKELSVIIVNWNSVDYLRQCLHNLYRGGPNLDMEVIVVDNASGDGCPAMLRKDFPGVLLVEANENLGFSRANNLGYRRSSGRVLLFLNPDTEVPDGVLPRMTQYVRSTQGVGAVGARLLNTDGTLQSSSVQAFPTITNQVLDCDFLRRWFPAWKLWGRNSLAVAQGRPAEVDAISGACFMILRSVFEEVQGFGEQYFMYSDDLDLSYRVRMAGYRVMCLADCSVTHHGGRSSDVQKSCFADVLQRESLARFFHETRGRSYAAAYRAAMMITAAVRLMIVLPLVVFHRLALPGKTTPAALRKSVAILRWSLGFENWARMPGPRLQA